MIIKFQFVYCIDRIWIDKYFIIISETFSNVYDESSTIYRYLWETNKSNLCSTRQIDVFNFSKLLSGGEEKNVTITFKFKNSKTCQLCDPFYKRAYIFYIYIVSKLKQAHECVYRRQRNSTAIGRRLQSRREGRKQQERNLVKKSIEIIQEKP